MPPNINIHNAKKYMIVGIVNSAVINPTFFKPKPTSSVPITVPVANAPHGTAIRLRIPIKVAL